MAEERHTSTSTRVLVFSYDENNSPIGFQFKTNDGPWYYYLYAKNIQGDIVALYRRDTDSSGNKIATHIANYEYDPWGKIISIKNAAGQDISNYPDNSANVNPLRYRGYYYDNESGFYYLQSRYYDPTIGRFINADGYVSTGQDFLGYNMFAYCGNNPVTALDPTGEWGFLSSLLTAVAVVATTVAVVSAAVVTAGAAVPVVAAITGTTLSSTAAASALGSTAFIAAGVAGTSIIGAANLEQDYICYSAKSTTYDPDPYRRPGQKKQGREQKNKAREKDGFKSRNNRRDGKPAPPKRHTPGRDHRKYKFSSKYGYSIE